jgi:hypothetical protein
MRGRTKFGCRDNLSALRDVSGQITQINISQGDGFRDPDAGIGRDSSKCRSVHKESISSSQGTAVLSYEESKYAMACLTCKIMSFFSFP